MINVLYISYTGLLDPLGQSQVLQYVRELGRNHRMTLLTFEKADNLQDRQQLAALESECAEAGVDWHHEVWHKSPPLAATLWDVARGSRYAIKLARAADAQVVHCRSYIGSLIGLQVKRATGARLIFDMRGFWADERADVGRWNRTGVVYKAVKRLEKLLFCNADHVVSLTRSGVREFQRFEYLADRAPPSTVIPTCTNLGLFAPQPRGELAFTLGYIGSVGGWYLFDQVAQVVSRLQQRDTNARFLAVNKGGHDLIRSALARAGADLARCELVECRYDEVGKHAARMSAGIFFIVPAWSKRASCPTRMGEFLGAGIPCMANSGVGDVEDDFNSTGTGVVLPVTEQGRVDLSNMDDALVRLIELSNAPATMHRCRKAAEKLFSLDSGVRSYDRIYRELAGA